MRQRAKAVGRKTLRRRSAPKVARRRSETNTARLTRERDEALEQQAATTEVLKAISRSTFDLKVVLETLIESATRLCGATRGHILQFNGEFLIFAAAHGAFPGFTEYLEAHPFRPGPGTIAGRAAANLQTVHVRDVLQERGYELTGLVKQQGYRTVLAVPMLREKALLGVITILKTNVEPFTGKQIELVKNFAAQAVIAIENTRLLGELRESLQRQAATADVLKVISRSPGQLEPVFKAMLENAVRICEAKFGTMLLREGDAFRAVALHNAPPAYVELRQRNPVIHPHPTSALSRIVATKQVVHIADIRLDQAYLAGAPSAVADTAGARTELLVPMLKDNELVGAILIYRQEVRPFTDKHIEVLTNFAAQAVIAIENSRLLSELRESQIDGGNYEPTLTASTKNLGDRVEIRIRDNGTGIAPDVKEKMFNPFFTTKPTGEGTGLGLSISHDIIVKQHAGAIEVDTQPGEFTEIIVTLPRTAVFV
jgi:signal transduction histidine kinase